MHGKVIFFFFLKDILPTSQALGHRHFPVVISPFGDWIQNFDGKDVGDVFPY